MTSPVDIVPLAEARAVSKRYGTTLALDNVTMTIQAGQSVALAGRNGAGKSTMVRLLTGLDRPDAGEVLFSGEPAPDVSARRMAVPGRLRLSEVDDHPGTHSRRESLHQRSAGGAPRSIAGARSAG